jgi:hypothetical protein
MKPEDIKIELEKILDEYSGSCLCGHFESCSNCDPFSNKTIIIKKIKELIQKI